ncbi:MAG: tRNA epoxyqueuosine(34) reductase QueG [Planctomycetia bacterium]
MLTHAALAGLAHAHGFVLVGVTGAGPVEGAGAAVQRWVEAGHGAGLDYMVRRPVERADPRALRPWARSVVSVAVPYGESAPPFEHERRYGRVARYAWGRDYHDVVLPRLRALAAELAVQPGAREARASCDHSPLLERALAARAGLGFVGKNTCLIRPGHGSWFLLGEVLVDLELEAVPAAPAGPGCGACTRCLVACPTAAFVSPYVLDARRCISTWTIEVQAPLPRELRARLGAWVFGCDDCQDACPYNGLDPVEAWPELAAPAGVGPRLDLAATLALRSEAAFARRFAATSLLRAGRAGVLRSAAVVARNIGATPAVPVLEACAAGDAAPVVRSHALWALAGLDASRARPLLERARRDEDAGVREEAEALLAGAA